MNLQRGRESLIFILLFSFIKNIYGETYSVYINTLSEYSSVGQYYHGNINGEGTFSDSSMAFVVDYPVAPAWMVQAQLTALGSEDYRLQVPQIRASYTGQVWDFSIGRMFFPLGWMAQDRDRAFDLDEIGVPDVFYSLHPYGPNVVHEDLTGLQLRFHPVEAWELTTSIGHTALVNGNLKQVLSAQMQIRPLDGLHGYAAAHWGMTAVDNAGGLLIDGENKILIAGGLQWSPGRMHMQGEWAHASFGPDALDTTVRYLHVSLRQPVWSPYLGIEEWRTTAGWGERVVRAGVARLLQEHLKLKIEWQSVDAFDVPRPDGTGVGLFDEKPEQTPVQIFSVGLQLKFDSEHAPGGGALVD